MALSPLQQRFVEAYLSGLPASTAYRRAGYRPKNDSSAESCASRLLRNAKVREAIDAATTKAAEDQQLTASWVLGRLKAEAEFHGDGATHAARIRAAELIGRHLGMFKDDAPPPSGSLVVLVVGGPARLDDL